MASVLLSPKRGMTLTPEYVTRELSTGPRSQGTKERRSQWVDSSVLTAGFGNSLQLNQDQLFWTLSNHREGKSFRTLPAAFPQPCRVVSAGAGWKPLVARERIPDGTCLGTWYRW